jgi:hypothetical protein
MDKSRSLPGEMSHHHGGQEFFLVEWESCAKHFFLFELCSTFCGSSNRDIQNCLKKRVLLRSCIEIWYRGEISIERVSGYHAWYLDRDNAKRCPSIQIPLFQWHPGTKSRYCAVLQVGLRIIVVPAWRESVVLILDIERGNSDIMLKTWRNSSYSDAIDVFITTSREIAGHSNRRFGDRSVIRTADSLPRS